MDSLKCWDFVTDDELIGDLREEIKAARYIPTPRPRQPWEYELDVVLCHQARLLKAGQRCEIKTYYRPVIKPIRRKPRAWWGWIIPLWRACQRQLAS